MRRLIAAAAMLAAAVAGRAEACPEASRTLLWHSCWGEAAVALHLLPEDLPLPALDQGAERLTVTGAYTSREPRAEGRPDPVGLFLRRGELVGRNLARMVGILLVGPDGGASIVHRRRVPLGSDIYDLGSLGQRATFIARARAEGLSVMQSHLLVIDGRSDVAEVENAPAYVRRMIFEDAHGIGLWQTRWPVTLHEAARAIVAEIGPAMAMNLDMGSYDFCLGEGPAGAVACGVIQPGGPEMAKLSNLLSLRLTRAPL